jgi:L-threonylcarbamoyladenylate synthase
VSVVLPCRAKRWAYLHRGTGTLAFRVPDKKQLRDFLRKTGPLVAPSANPQGNVPAETIVQARKYFGNAVNCYVDRGSLVGSASTVVTFRHGMPVVLRQGDAVIVRG